MTRRLSMTTRLELTEAVGARYRRSDRNEKRQITMTMRCAPR